MIQGPHLPETTGTTHPAPPLWSELLLRSLAELRELTAVMQPQPNADSANDFVQLFESGQTTQ